MDNKTKKLMAGMLFGVLLVIPLTRVSAGLVWEDDFNDGDLEGWVLKTYYTTDFSNVPVVKGEALIRNDNKRMLLPPIYNGTHEGLSNAKRASTQVHGHWSFDVDTRAGSQSEFWIINRDLTPETDREDEGWYLQKPTGFEGYGVSISTASADITLMRMDANFTNMGPNATDVADIILDSIRFSDTGFSKYGVFHIDITRKPDGNMTVYLNSTKAMSVIDNEYTISEVVAVSNFVMTTYYDNIRVDDDYNWPFTIETTTTETTMTTTTTTPETTAAAEWGIFLFSLGLILFIFRKRRQ